MQAPLLKVRGLRRGYGGHLAVKNLDLDLCPGQIIGLLGPNGAGKSTCLRMLSGTLMPDAGSILIDGLDLYREPLQAKARIGYLPDKPPLYDDMRVEEYLRYAARLHGLNGRQIRHAVAQTLERCALGEVRRKLIQQLSQGYRQRLGLAQALVHNPDLLILDEPSVALDPIQIQEIRSLIIELGRENAVLLSSHILPEVQSVCSRVLILHQGETVHQGPVQDDQDGLYLGLAQSPGIDELKRLPGVDRAERMPDGGYLLQGAQLDAESIARECIQKSWGLRQIRPRQSGLEQIFLRHVAGDAS